jgi:hypothetical protein
MLLLTRKGSTVSSHGPTWVDETFLWTVATLAVLGVAAAVPAPGAWPAGIRVSPGGVGPPLWRGGATAASLPVAPAPLISFGEPVPGYPVVSPFGLRQLPWEGGGRLHKGVDIAAPKDTPVLAAADGMVLRTGVDAGYGRFLEVQDAAGLTTLYGHLDAYAQGMLPGAALKQGEVIGRLGSTGSSTGPHLHFEVHDDQGRAMNPVMFLGRSFATATDLPLKQALRMPRGMRVAFVSLIPAQRAAQMLQRLEDEAAKAELEEETELEAIRKAQVRAQLARGWAQKRVVIASAAPVRPVAAPAAVRPSASTSFPDGLRITPTPSGARIEATIDPKG